MQLLKRKILIDYQLKHADSRIPLNSWMNLIRLAKWKTPQDIKNAINSVDFLSGNRVIFYFKTGESCEMKWKDRSRSESWTDEMKKDARKHAMSRWSKEK